MVLEERCASFLQYGARAGFSVVSGRNDLMGSIPMCSTEENEMKIQKGYNVIVESWENDGDSESTQIINCETLEEAAFLANLAKKFTSRSRGHVALEPGVDIDSVKGYGNDSVNGETLKDIIKAVFDRYGSEKLYSKYEYAMDDFRGDDFDNIALELTRDLLGCPSNDVYLFEFDNFCRVCESVEVYHVSETPKLIRV